MGQCIWVSERRHFLASYKIYCMFQSTILLPRKKEPNEPSLQTSLHPIVLLRPIRSPNGLSFRILLNYLPIDTNSPGQEIKSWRRNLRQIRPKYRSTLNLTRIKSGSQLVRDLRTRRSARVFRFARVCPCQGRRSPVQYVPTFLGCAPFV